VCHRSLLHSCNHGNPEIDHARRQNRPRRGPFVLSSIPIFRACTTIPVQSWNLAGQEISCFYKIPSVNRCLCTSTIFNSVLHSHTLFLQNRFQLYPPIYIRQFSQLLFFQKVFRPKLCIYRFIYKCYTSGLVLSDFIILTILSEEYTRYSLHDCLWFFLYLSSVTCSHTAAYVLPLEW
jgi:hypothetical protein